MTDNKMNNAYDDDDIPQVDLPGGANKNSMKNSSKNSRTVNYKETPLPEPLPESTRPRQDGPGGN